MNEKKKTFVERLEERRLDDLGVLARREDLWDKFSKVLPSEKKNYRASYPGGAACGAALRGLGSPGAASAGSALAKFRLDV